MARKWWATGRVTKAAAAVAPFTSNTGMSQLGYFPAYVSGEARARAMQVPTITRGRDLICGTIGTLELEMVRHIWNGEELEAVTIAPRSWLQRIDSGNTNAYTLSWTADDLLFYGQAFWAITERTADGYPSAFTRMPAASVTLVDQPGPIRYGPSNQILFLGQPVDARNVVQFISPIEGLVYTTSRAIETALKLEQARYRNASSSIPSVVLMQKSGEPLSAQELEDMCTAFDMARLHNQTAAVNEHIEVKETYATPDKMLLIEAADYQARDLCRAIGVPAYLAGIATGAYSYTNSRSAREDLLLFGMRPLIQCITDTLSSDNVLPHGTGVRFRLDKYLAEMAGEDSSDRPQDTPDSGQENTQERLAR
jgi:hypothetical protein